MVIYRDAMVAKSLIGMAAAPQPSIPKQVARPMLRAGACMRALEPNRQHMRTPSAERLQKPLTVLTRSGIHGHSSRAPWYNIREKPRGAARMPTRSGRSNVAPTASAFGRDPTPRTRWFPTHPPRSMPTLETSAGSVLPGEKTNRSAEAGGRLTARAHLHSCAPGPRRLHSPRVNIRLGPGSTNLGWGERVRRPTSQCPNSSQSIGQIRPSTLREMSL